MAHICLSPEHIADLQKSGLNKVTIEKLKFRSVSPNELNKLGVNFQKWSVLMKFPTSSYSVI